METKNKISAIVVDSEVENIAVISELITSNFKDVELVGSSTLSSELMNLIHKHVPDIVYLDSNLVLTEFLDYIRSENRDVELVFITEDDSFAIKAFEYSALYCIQKPIGKGEFAESINRLRKKRAFSSFNRLESIYEEKKGGDCRIMLPDVFGFKLVNVNEIIRCEADGCYTNFYLDNGERIVVSKSLAGFVNLLPKYLFCRVHSKHLVNLNFVQQYIKGRGGMLILLDGSSVEVSEKKKKDFIDQLGLLGYSFFEGHQKSNKY